MAKCVAHRKGDNTSNSVSISFTKDQETGLYKKVEKDIRLYHKDHKTKSVGKERISEEFYKLSNQEDFDYTYEVSGPGGKTVSIYFKKVEKNNS